MNQSTIIFGFLFAAFVIFITQRGELPTYAGFFLATPTTPVSGPSVSTGSVASTASTLTTIAGALAGG